MWKLFPGDPQNPPDPPKEKPAPPKEFTGRRNDRGQGIGRMRAISLISMLLFACGQEKSESRWFAMDTEFVAVAYGRGHVNMDSVFSRLKEEAARIENRFSDYSDSSDLNRLSGIQGDTLSLDPELALLFSMAESLSLSSSGRFDITLGPLKHAYGLGSGETGKIPSESEISKILMDNPAFHGKIPGDSGFPSFRILSGNKLIFLRDSLRFDLGAIAKGYAVDRLSGLLDSMGFPAHIIQAGGDMKCVGVKPDGEWNIGIRHPRHPDSICGSIRTGPSAISTSGDYERCFFSGGKRYHHILDPSTGRPAAPFASVTILASGSRIADGLSTTLFILGPGGVADTLLRSRDAEALWIRENPDQSLCAVVTKGFRKKLSSFVIPVCPK